jgi:phenylpropionate dioxygenase-like ring-hydroxylating dioxygenase large terminal subunit
MAYLRSVFPGQFTAASAAAASSGGAHVSLPAWAYDSPRLHALEREHVFQNAWQFVAHCARLDAAGDYLSSDLGFERALLVRGADGELRALRNSCPAAPHALVAPGAGRLRTIQCRVHSLRFGLDGRALSGGADLRPMDVAQVAELLLVRSAPRPPLGAAFPDRWSELAIAPGARGLPAPADTPVAADWKVVAELFLGFSASPPLQGWSARCYQRLTSHAAGGLRHHFLAPNHWMSVRPDGWTLLQVLPLGPGSCRLRRYGATWCDADAPARAAQYLAARLFAIDRVAYDRVAYDRIAHHRASDLGLAESIQRGIALGHQSSHVRSAEVSAFHRQLLTILPVMGSDKPPGDF